jgi:hypothetical protein
MLTTKLVNTLPLPAQSTPANSPPQTAGLSFTRESGDHQHVGREAAQAREQAADRSHLLKARHHGIARERGREAHCDAHQQREDEHHAQIFAEAAREAARPIHPPDEIEAALDLLRHL